MPFDCHPTSWFLFLVQLFKVAAQRFPFSSFNSFFLCEWLDERTSSASKVNSSAPSPTTVSHASLSPDRLGTSTQAAHIHCLVVVYFDEVPDASTTIVPQTCDNAFNRDTTILLLMRQKLQRDQVITQLLWCCMRFDNFRFMCSTLLFKQPVGRFPMVLATACLRTTHQLHCHILPKETIATRARVTMSRRPHPMTLLGSLCFFRKMSFAMLRRPPSSEATLS